MFRKALILVLANLICAGTALAKAPTRIGAAEQGKPAIVRVVVKEVKKHRVPLRFKVSRPVTLRAELSARTAACASRG